jgi:ABC-2 type transport system ATP-binding protein
MLERIGIVLQECDFPRHLRVAELLSAWRGYYPSPLPLAELLDVVELREERGTLVRRLSGGQRRRLDFALALAGDPDLMFLDEPATGFGLEARRRCWAVIGNLRSLGKTILLTMHQLDEAERLSDRVAILSDGRIQMAGTPRALAREVGAPTRISFSVPERLRRGEIGPPEGTRQAAVASGARAPGGGPGACGSWRTRPGWSSARSGGTRSTRCSRSRFRWSCPWCSGPPSPATSSRSPTPARSHCSCRECWPSA